MKEASLVNLKNVQFTSHSGNPETKIEKVEEYGYIQLRHWIHCHKLCIVESYPTTADI